MTNKAFYLILLIVLPGIILSCKKESEDDLYTPPGATTIVIEATSYTDWVYFSFDKGDIITVASPDTSLEWDMAFLRNHMRTNSGTSGPGVGGTYDAGIINFEDLTQAPDNGYVVDDAISISDVNDPTRQTMIEVPGNTVLETWGTFDTDVHPPTFTPSDKLYVVKTADGKYAKTWFSSYYGYTGASANIVMHYNYQSNASRNFE